MGRVKFLRPMPKEMSLSFAIICRAETSRIRGIRPSLDYLLFGKLGAFALRETVTEGSEPLIERQDATSVVTFEITMVQVVEIAA